jgi:hypothetical protein
MTGHVVRLKDFTRLHFKGGAKQVTKRNLTSEDFYNIVTSAELIALTCRDTRVVTYGDVTSGEQETRIYMDYDVAYFDALTGTLETRKADGIEHFTARRANEKRPDLHHLENTLLPLQMFDTIREHATGRAEITMNGTLGNGVMDAQLEGATFLLPISMDQLKGGLIRLGCQLHPDGERRLRIQQKPAIRTAHETYAERIDRQHRSELNKCEW